MKIRKKKRHAAMAFQEIARFDSFLILAGGDGQHKWLRLTTIDGGWRMDFRDDNMKYAWIVMCLEEEHTMAALEAWVILLYHLSHRFCDIQLMEDCFNAIERLDTRQTALIMQKEEEKNKENGVKTD